MTEQLINGIVYLAAIAVGTFVGAFFGTMQSLAFSKNKKRHDVGTLPTGWLVMPGSMGRVAVLLIILVAIQIGLPFLFKGNIEWLVSIGVILGYGGILLREMRHRSAERARS